MNIQLFRNVFHNFVITRNVFQQQRQLYIHSGIKQRTFRYGDLTIEWCISHGTVSLFQDLIHTLDTKSRIQLLDQLTRHDNWPLLVTTRDPLLFNLFIQEYYRKFMIGLKSNKKNKPLCDKKLLAKTITSNSIRNAIQLLQSTHLYSFDRVMLKNIISDKSLLSVLEDVRINQGKLELAKEFTQLLAGYILEYHSSLFELTSYVKNVLLGVISALPGQTDLLQSIIELNNKNEPTGLLEGYALDIETINYLVGLNQESISIDFINRLVLVGGDLQVIKHLYKHNREFKKLIKSKNVITGILENVALRGDMEMASFFLDQVKGARKNNTITTLAITNSIHNIGMLNYLLTNIELTSPPPADKKINLFLSLRKALDVANFDAILLILEKCIRNPELCTLVIYYTGVEMSNDKQGIFYKLFSRYKSINDIPTVLKDAIANCRQRLFNVQLLIYSTLFGYQDIINQLTHEFPQLTHSERTNILKASNKNSDMLKYWYLQLQPFSFSYLETATFSRSDFIYGTIPEILLAHEMGIININKLFLYSIQSSKTEILQEILKTHKWEDLKKNLPNNNSICTKYTTHVTDKSIFKLLFQLNWLDKRIDYSRLYTISVKFGFKGLKTFLKRFQATFTNYYLFVVILLSVKCSSLEEKLEIQDYALQIIKDHPVGYNSVLKFIDTHYGSKWYARGKQLNLLYLACRLGYEKVVESIYSEYYKDGQWVVQIFEQRLFKYAIKSGNQQIVTFLLQNTPSFSSMEFKTNIKNWMISKYLNISFQFFKLL